jgi:hypothetical protein
LCALHTIWKQRRATMTTSGLHKLHTSCRYSLTISIVLIHHRQSETIVAWYVWRTLHLQLMLTDKLPVRSPTSLTTETQGSGMVYPSTCSHVEANSHETSAVLEQWSPNIPTANYLLSPSAVVHNYSHGAVSLPAESVNVNPRSMLSTFDAAHSPAK